MGIRRRSKKVCEVCDKLACYIRYRIGFEVRQECEFCADIHKPSK